MVTILLTISFLPIPTFSIVKQRIKEIDLDAHPIILVLTYNKAAKIFVLTF